MPTESKTTAAKTDPNPSVNSRLAPLIPITQVATTQVKTRSKCADPTCMDVGHDLHPLGLAEEGDHGNDDQQRFQSLAQQNRGRAEERREAACCVRRQRSFRVVEKVVEDLHPIGECIGILSAPDRGAVLAHRTLDPLHQHAVSCGQRGFNRLEAIEIGRQGQLAGALSVPRTISGEAFGQAAANQRQRATLLSHHVGMATQVGHDGVRVVLPDLVGKRCGRRASESLQIGDEPVKRSVLPPKPLPLRRSGVRKGEMTSVECQGPAVIS